VPDAAAARPPEEPPTAPRPAPEPAARPDPYAPRRRYPWHDDPNYDPAAYRRAPGQWTPPPPAPPYPAYSGPAAPAGVDTTAPWPAAPPDPTARSPLAAAPTTRVGPSGHPNAGPHPTPPRGEPTRTTPVGHAAPSTAAYPDQSAHPGTTPVGHPPPSTAAYPDQSAHPGATPPAADQGPPPPGAKLPRKLTVTRVAAMRGRQFAEGSVRAFHRAATADGADRSGLTALTYATMMTYAVDAAVAVALANTLFFAAARAESVTNVALYLAITAAPFAVVAPVIGPLLDRVQRGRRAALALTFALRAVLAVVMAFQYHTWLLYPAALGTLVLSKSFVVLKAAVTPRVLPSAITLVTTNSRLTTFGLAAGGVFGGIAAGVAWLWGSEGALLYTALLAVAGTVLCLRIPKWVESTAGEVPAALRATRRGRRIPMSRSVVVALWGNGAIRVLTGFLTLFVAFVIKQTDAQPTQQLLLIGIVGAAAGVGSFAGNGAGSRPRSLSGVVVLWCVGAAVVVAAVAAALPGIATAAVVGLVGAAASALAKVSLDAAIQRDLPEESRASAFGRSETVLQLAWVTGGALGVLLPHDTFWVGFTVVACVVALVGVQTALLYYGRSIAPFLAVQDRPVVPTVPAARGS
jgi:MFS family permease